MTMSSNPPDKDLLPCPFCGSKAESDSWDITDDADAVVGYKVWYGCKNSSCHIRPSVCDNSEHYEKLLDMWNTRTPALAVSRSTRDQIAEILNKHYSRTDQVAIGELLELIQPTQAVSGDDVKIMKWLNERIMEDGLAKKSSGE
jgi:hypothetical protein